MSLIQQNAYRSIKMLQDTSRFTVINLNNTDYVFDGYTYMSFLLPPVIQKLMTSGDDRDILNTLHEMKENDLKCFCLFSARSINTEFVKPVLKTNKTTRCDVLLNLGSECDLDCAYCYRDKNAHKRTDIETATAAVKFAQHVYKPHAEGYSVSFDISSEPLMERQEMQSFVNSYTELEQYWFQKDEFLDGTAIDFYMMLPETVRGLNDFPKTDDEAVKLINELLLRKDLLGLLDIQKLNETQKYIINEYGQIENMPDWKLVRLNHWGFEALFPKIIKHRQSPFVSFWYMSNGTLLNEHDIALIKGCGISPFVVSIDGPEWLHNKLRPYENGKDSYSDVCRSIALLRKNDIPVRASVVITNLYPAPLEIALHLKEQGVTGIKMTIIRGKSDLSFMPENVHLLVEGYTGLFNRLESDFDNHDFSLFRFLTDDTSLRPLHNLLNRSLIIKRCPWGEQIAVDCKGDIYPCNYVIGNKKFRQGNIKDLSFQDADTEYLWIDNRPTCKDCWARYVCGGTCCYNAYIRNGAENSCEEVECIINKLCVVFCIKLE